eukprot:357840-Chlamydomonas_euryale.AAC.3
MCACPRPPPSINLGHNPYLFPLSCLFHDLWLFEEDKIASSRFPHVFLTLGLPKVYAPPSLLHNPVRPFIPPFPRSFPSSLPPFPSSSLHYSVPAFMPFILPYLHATPSPLPFTLHSLHFPTPAIFAPSLPGALAHQPSASPHPPHARHPHTSHITPCLCFTHAMHRTTSGWRARTAPASRSSRWTLHSRCGEMRGYGGYYD